MRFLLITILSLLMLGVQAQSKSKKKKSSSETAPSSVQPSTLSPSTPQKEYGPKKSKKGKVMDLTYGSEEDYYKRMAALEKSRRKNERMMEKPQYSDPMYFGHKHPPKKHKPGKMKYCKVCGLRH